MTAATGNLTADQRRLFNGCEFVVCHGSHFVEGCELVRVLTASALHRLGARAAFGDQLVDLTHEGFVAALLLANLVEAWRI